MTAKPVKYVKWLTIKFLYTKFEQNRPINRSELANYWFLLFLVTAAILDIGRKHRTQFLLIIQQGSLPPNLVQIGSVVSEEKIKVYARTHGRTPCHAISSHGFAR